MTLWVVWIAWNARHMLCLRYWKQPTLAAMKLREMSPEEESVLRGHIGWRKFGGLMSWTVSLWLGQRTHAGNPDIFTAGFLEKICLSRHTECSRSCANTGGPSTFHENSVFVWNSRLASAWFRSQPHERGRSRAAAGTDLEASTSSKHREYPSSEDLIVDCWGSFDVNLSVFAKVSALVQALRLGGS